MPDFYHDEYNGVSFRELPDGKFERVLPDPPEPRVPPPTIDLRWPAKADELRRDADRILPVIGKLEQTASGRMIVESFYSRLDELRAWMIETATLARETTFCLRTPDSLWKEDFLKRAEQWLSATAYPEIGEAAKEFSDSVDVLAPHWADVDLLAPHLDIVDSDGCLTVVPHVPVRQLNPVLKGNPWQEFGVRVDIARALAAGVERGRSATAFYIEEKHCESPSAEKRRQIAATLRDRARDSVALKAATLCGALSYSAATRQDVVAGVAAIREGLEAAADEAFHDLLWSRLAHRPTGLTYAAFKACADVSPQLKSMFEKASHPVWDGEFPSDN